MLKLDKSKTTQTLAIHLDTTASIDNLVLQYTSSYDRNSGSMDFVVDNTKGRYRVGTLSGSAVPSASGQYNINIYQGADIPAVWNQVTASWATYDEIWSTAGDFGVTGSLLRTIRAFVSGSNDASFTEYTSPNELGAYTTYNG